MYILSSMPNLRCLSIFGGRNRKLGTAEMDFSLRHVGSMALLEKLDLSNCDMRDDDMKHLSKLKFLTHLILTGCLELNGSFASYFIEVPITHLNMQKTGLCCGELKCLWHLQNLQYLDISWCKYGDEEDLDRKSVLEICKMVSSLRFLDTTGSVGLTKKDLHDISCCNSKVCVVCDIESESEIQME